MPAASWLRLPWLKDSRSGTHRARRDWRRPLRAEQLEVRCLPATIVTTWNEISISGPEDLAGEMTQVAGDTLTFEDGTVLAVTGFSWDGPVVVPLALPGEPPYSIGGLGLFHLSVLSGPSTPALLAAAIHSPLMGDVVLTTVEVSGKEVRQTSTWTLHGVTLEHYQVAASGGDARDQLSLAFSSLEIAYVDPTSDNDQRTAFVHADGSGDDPGLGSSTTTADTTLTLENTRVEVLDFAWHPASAIEATGGESRRPELRMFGGGEIEITVAADTAIPGLVDALWDRTLPNPVLTQRLSSTQNVTWTLDQPGLRGLRFNTDSQGRPVVVLTLNVGTVHVTAADGTTTQRTTWSSNSISGPEDLAGEVTQVLGNTLTFEDGTVLAVTGFSWDGPVLVPFAPPGWPQYSIDGFDLFHVSVLSGPSTPALLRAAMQSRPLGDVVLTTVRGSGKEVEETSTWTLHGVTLEYYQASAPGGGDARDRLSLAFSGLEIAYVDSTADNDQRTAFVHADGSGDDPGLGSSTTTADTTLTLENTRVEVLDFEWHPTSAIEATGGESRRPERRMVGSGEIEITVAADTATPGLVDALWDRTLPNPVLTQRLSSTQNVTWTLDQPALKHLRFETDSQGRPVVVLKLKVGTIDLTGTDGTATHTTTWSTGSIGGPEDLAGEVTSVVGNTLTFDDGTVLAVSGFSWDGPIIEAPSDANLGLGLFHVSVFSGHSTPALLLAAVQSPLIGDVVLTTVEISGREARQTSTWTLHGVALEHYEAAASGGEARDQLSLAFSSLEIAYVDPTADNDQRAAFVHADGSGDDPGFGSSTSTTDTTLTLESTRVDVLGFQWLPFSAIEATGESRRPEQRMLGGGEIEITVAADTSTPGLVDAFWDRMLPDPVLTQRLSSTQTVTWTFDDPTRKGLRFETSSLGQPVIVLTLTVRSIQVAHTDDSNQPPVANSETAITLQNVPRTIDVLTNDSDADQDALTVVSIDRAGTQGATTLNIGGTITYAPPAGFAGLDTFRYTLGDGHGGTSTATVTVIVNRPPVAAFVISDVTTDGTAGNMAPRTLLLNPAGSSDPDAATGDSIVTYGWAFGDGTAEVSSTGSVLHTYSGVGTFTATLTVTDSRGARSMAATQAIVTRGTISGSVYDDANGNGKRDAGEVALSGTIVFLDLNQNGMQELGEPNQAVTSSGAYSFTNVGAGQPVRVKAPAGTVLTSAGLHSIAQGQSAVASGRDFGLFRLGSISGTLFNDLNGDGLRTLTEPLLLGRQIYLDLDGDAVRDASEPVATSDPKTGTYSFAQVVGPGAPAVRPVSLAVGEYVTNPNGKLSAALSSGNALTNQHLGLAMRGSVSGVVFLDVDGDGLFDAGEKGISGRSVGAFLDRNGNDKFDAGEPTATVVTDAFGNYSFNKQLIPGTWRVAHVLSGGWVASSPGGNTHEVVIISGNTFEPRNFSGFLPASISGVVFEDANGNGTQDGGEQGLANWRVYLDVDGNGRRTRHEPMQRTNDSGAFWFDNLKPGTYHVRQILECGYATGPAGTRRTETLISGQAIDAAFANYQPVSVRGTVFGDSNGDGLQDENERGLPGRIVVLERIPDSEATTALKAVAVTNVRGTYHFEKLPPGNYRVRLFRIENASTSDSRELALVSSRKLQGIDFGFLKTGRDRSRRVADGDRLTSPGSA